MDKNRHLLLIVADHDRTRDTLTRLLKDRGWTVRSASTVDEGLTPRDAEPACVVLDSWLIEGREEPVLQRMRSAHPRARLVILCEPGEEGRVRAYSEVEPEAVVRRPVEMNEFLAACERRHRVCPSGGYGSQDA
jgi:DNA-binding response OmpR family regulator